MSYPDYSSRNSVLDGITLYKYIQSITQRTAIIRYFSTLMQALTIALAPSISPSHCEMLVPDTDYSYNEASIPPGVNIDRLVLYIGRWMEFAH